MNGQVVEKHGQADPQLEKMFQRGLTADRYRAICKRNGRLTAVEVQERLDSITRDAAMFFRVRL